MVPDKRRNELSRCSGLGRLFRRKRIHISSFLALLAFYSIPYYSTHCTYIIILMKQSTGVLLCFLFNATRNIWRGNVWCERVNESSGYQNSMLLHMYQFLCSRATIDCTNYHTASIPQIGILASRLILVYGYAACISTAYIKLFMRLFILSPCKMTRRAHLPRKILLTTVAFLSNNCEVAGQSIRVCFCFQLSCSI